MLYFFHGGFSCLASLSCSSSRSDPSLSLSRQGAALTHLDSLPLHDLVFWTDGSDPFRFGKGGSGILANCSLCGTKATLSFYIRPSMRVFPLKPAPFCTFFAGLSSTNNSATSLLLSDSRSVFATLSSPPSFLLPETLWQIWQELPSLSSCSIRLQWVPGHSFLPGSDAADELARRGVLLAPSAIPCSLSLVSRINSCFSRTGGVLPHGSSLTHRSPRFPPRNLCTLVMLAVFSRLRCNGHSLLLGSYYSRISRIENPSCSACGHSSQDTSHLILHRPATESLRYSLFSNSLSLYGLWSRPWRVARLLGLHGYPPCPHPSQGVG